MEENYLLFQNIEINELLKPIKIILCSKCNITIDKLIGSAKICRTCFNIQCKKYNKNRTKKEKKPRKNVLKEYEYITPQGENTTVRLKDVNKKCKTCNEIKHYTNFYMVRDLKTKYNYLNPKCMICLNLYYNTLRKKK